MEELNIEGVNLEEENLEDYGYPDLLDENYVFFALLGHGMFSDKLPACFSSESFLEFAENNSLIENFRNHAYVEYSSTRNTNVPRQFAVPHPESYWSLCESIKKNWNNINKHIGKPEKKFNFCHVRKIKEKENIFDMNYDGVDKWSKEEIVLEYSLGCKYIVIADVSTFFPSVYTHSIPWAVNGKEWAKIHRCESWKNRIGNCKYNNDQPCMNENSDLWPNDLDTISRSIKDGETNGILIGPHSSNIISEIILSQIDNSLQQSGFNKVVRHIDDFEFFAQNEDEAKLFLTTLSTELKKYELALNAKKTRIIPFHEYTASHWISQLFQFSFPTVREEIGFTSVNSYIDYSLNIAKENNNFAALNYAMKVISKKKLSRRAKRAYIKKILQISLDHPYIIPLLEKDVFKFSDEVHSFLNDYLKHLLKRSIRNGLTDALSFVFYFAIKYGILIENISFEKIIELNDCVSTVLAYKYCVKNDLSISLFNNKAENLLNFPERDQDKFWLFLYEILPAERLSDFFKKLKQEEVSFIKFSV